MATVTVSTSAQLAAQISDETGTGALVFATSCTLVTPALGTPASGTLTSCTGLPISTGVSGLGANVAAFLATPSSANLISAVTDETGTGALVFGTSPTIATPTFSGAVTYGTSQTITADAGGFEYDTPAADTHDFQIASSSVLEVGSSAISIKAPDLMFAEKADHASTPAAGKGYLWVKSTAPTTLIFTDDTGADTTLGTGDTGSLGITIDGAGSAITTGIKGDIRVPFACTINKVTMLADQSGSAVVDIWKDTYANYPPTDADSITASAVPTITTATKSEDGTLTGWTTSVTAGDTIRFNVDSASTITRLTLILDVTKT